MMTWIHTTHIALFVCVAGCAGSPRATDPHESDIPPQEGVSTAKLANLDTTWKEMGVQPLVDGCPPHVCGTNGVWLGENIRFHEIDTKQVLSNAILYHPSRGQILTRELSPITTAYSLPPLLQPIQRLRALRLSDALGRAKVGALSYRGFRLKNDTQLALKVDGDELIGTANGRSYKREDLRGAVIRLADSFSAAQYYELKIIDYMDYPLWVQGGSVPLYEFEFTNSLNPSVTCKICDDNIGAKDAFKGTVVIFEGDRYQNDLDVLEVGGETTKFNIACMGTSISKLHFLRHTWAGEQHTPRLDTTVEQRETLLRMLAADYCGTGKGFTVDGHPLNYKFGSTLQWGTTFDTQHEIEAIWGPGGALCLDTPRLVDQMDQTQLREMITQECKRTLPSCLRRGESLERLLASYKQRFPNAYAISMSPRRSSNVQRPRCDPSLSPTGTGPLPQNHQPTRDPAQPQGPGPLGGPVPGSGGGNSSTTLPPCPWNRSPQISCS